MNLSLRAVGKTAWQSIVDLVDSSLATQAQDDGLVAQNDDLAVWIASAVPRNDDSVDSAIMRIYK